MKQNELLRYLQSALDAEEPVDILPVIREHIQDFDELIDTVIDWDLQVQTFRGGYLNLTAKSFEIEGHELKPTKNEADYVEYYGKSIVSPGELVKYLAIIMISDCTGCCNALDKIEVSKGKLFACGTVSQTYHS